MIRRHWASNFTGCFENLYNRYAGKVYKQYFFITKDAAQAQDFTHDIFIRIFASLDQFKGGLPSQPGCTALPTITASINSNGQSGWQQLQTVMG